MSTPTGISPGIDIISFIKKGQGIYSQNKDVIETSHPGEYVAIEVHSGRYFFGSTREGSVKEARKEFPDAIFFVSKIGTEEKVARHSRSHSGVLRYARLF